MIIHLNSRRGIKLETSTIAMLGRFFNIISTVALALFAVYGMIIIIGGILRRRDIGGPGKGSARKSPDACRSHRQAGKRIFLQAFCVAALAAFALEATAFNFQHYLKFFAGPELQTENVSPENPNLLRNSDGTLAEIVTAKTNGSISKGIRFKNLNRKVTSIFAQIEFTAGKAAEMQVQWTDEKSTGSLTKKIYKYKPHENYAPIRPSGKVSELIVLFKGIENGTSVNLVQVALNRQIPFYFNGLRLIILSLLIFAVLAVCGRERRAKVSYLLNEEKYNKLFIIASNLAISCCCVWLFPQVRSFIIEFAGQVLERDLRTFGMWINVIFAISLFAIITDIQNFCWRNRESREKISVYASIRIVAASVIVITVMYVKCRALWLDEALLAESIVSRNLSGLLVPPLSNGQSAPVFYVISVKLIGLIFGHSEFSLRVFSLLAFIGLLICEKTFLKRALGYNHIQIAFVIVITALLPAYIWYSNELKPYMGDAFLIILAILLYFYYTHDKIKLPALTVFYILILGFSSPAIFFIGGILSSEFLTTVFKKNKKQALFVLISGVIVLAVFCLYYFWWMVPALEPMKGYWGKNNLRGLINEISRIFSPLGGARDSTFVWFFVPFALLGIFSSVRSRNKIVYSVAMSLFFTILASAMGYWPVTGRLWLFLPAIVFIFTPAGIDFIHNKIKHGEFTHSIEFSFFSAIIVCLSINCLGFAGSKMWYPSQEINPLIHYVQKNIKDNEKLYVYPGSQAAFKYKNGYTKTKIGNVVNDNIIYGKDMDEWNKSVLGSELRAILENEKTYLIFSHYWRGINPGLSVLQKYGTLTQVMNNHNTPLFYFERKSE